MILAWMLYSVAVTLLLGAAALAAERCVRLFGKGARWVWVVAFAAAVSLPAVGLAFPDARLPLPSVSQTDLTGTALSTMVWELPNRMLEDSGSNDSRFELAVLALWGVCSLLLLALYSWSWWRLWRETRSCWPARVGGIPVLVSSVLGPAVIGLRKQAIVLPSWVLECEAGVRTMIAKHEFEHVEKGDQRLVLAAFLIVLLLPWNLALWWYLARLRLAVEMDCDLRLLRAGANLHTYSRLLLEIGTRLGSAPAAALAFSRNRSSLFRRIQHMTAKPRRRVVQASAVGAAALAFVFLACETPLPLQNDDGSRPSLAETASDESAPEEVTVVVRSNENEPVLYIDDVRIHQPIEVVIDTLSRERIDRIEVVKGAAAEAVLGESASGGPVYVYIYRLKKAVGHEGGGAPGS